MAFLLETSILEDSWDLVRLEAAPLFFFVPPSFLPGLYFSLTVSLSMQLTSSFSPVAYYSVFSLSSSLAVNVI